MAGTRFGAGKFGDSAGHSSAVIGDLKNQRVSKGKIIIARGNLACCSRCTSLGIHPWKGTALRWHRTEPGHTGRGVPRLALALLLNRRQRDVSTCRAPNAGFARTLPVRCCRLTRSHVLLALLSMISLGGGVYLGVHPQSLHTPSQEPPELVPFFGFVIGVKLEPLHGSHVV